MGKVDKYKILSPFGSKGKVFAKHGTIVSSEDISEHDIPKLVKGGYIKLEEEDVKSDSFNENVVDPVKSFFKKKKKNK